MALSDLVRSRVAWIQSSKGLEKYFDLDILDQEEYLIFRRKFSLLQEKIRIQLKERTPEESLFAIIAMAKKGYCGVCYEVYKQEIGTKRKICRCTRNVLSSLGVKIIAEIP